MLELLTDKLQNVFRRLSSRGVVSEKDLEEALREVRIALLEADVNFKVVREFINGVREQATGAEILGLTEAAGHRHVQRQLVHIFGDPQLICLLATADHRHADGLMGSWQDDHRGEAGAQHGQSGRARFVAADPHRVAAGEQLLALGRQLNVPVYAESGAPAAVAQGAREEAHRLAANVLIVDTPGYMQVASDMLSEAKELHDSFSPNEVLLVVDAMTGQEANVAQEFHDALNVTGHRTKMDVRRGAAFPSAPSPAWSVKFIGTGVCRPGLPPTQPAHPRHGDGSPIERAQETVDQEQAKSLERRMRRHNGPNDFVSQIQQAQKMGTLTDIVTIPGLGGVKKQLKRRSDDSGLEEDGGNRLPMTPEERHRPDAGRRGVVASPRAAARRHKTSTSC
jgi:signal recognition particle subunit SRP54